MIGTITRILALSGIHAANGHASDEVRRLAGLDFPAAYVSYEPRLLSSAGWYGYRIAFRASGLDIERAMRALRDVFDMRDSYEYRNNGIYIFAMLFRYADKHYGIGGGGAQPPGPSPIDAWWGLKLTMPEGGTVILRKNGSPNAVSLEVSTDGTNWQPWTLVGTDYSYTLQAGETLCIRNTISDHVVGLMKGLTDYYRFVFDANVYANGSVMSMVCNDENRVSLGNISYCFGYLFDGCDKLITAPELPATILAGSAYYHMFSGCSSLRVAPTLPAKEIKASCYSWMFYKCTSLEAAPELPATTLPQQCYYRMFQDCTRLSEIRTNMTDISAYNCINNWLNRVSATGDLYCPSSLTIPTGTSGIPTGWTRHDI